MNNHASVSVNDLYRMLLPLSNSSKLWLGKKLIADANRSCNGNAKHRLAFPHVPKNRQISAKAMSMVIGKMPENFDFDKATDEMWEDFAK